MRNISEIKMGTKFGSWTIISLATRKFYTNHTHIFYKCICGCCKKEFEVRRQALLSGVSTKCKNCSRKLWGKKYGGKHFTHGLTNSRTYEIWCGMLKRCYNTAAKTYKDYGGRGITVDFPWHDFEFFFADMGHVPKNRTLERINNAAGYSKENCKWASRKEQNRNTRRNNYIEYAGEKKCVSAWSEQLGIKVQTLRSRLFTLKWPIEKAFKTGVIKNREA